MKLIQPLSDNDRLVIYNTKWGSEYLFLDREYYRNGKWEKHNGLLITVQNINDLQELLTRVQKLLPLL